MQRNVHSFRVIIKKGYSPCLYSYDEAKIPVGLFEATLDFKTWSKRIIAINCYFTKTDTGEKFVVTVYCNYTTGKYMLANSVVDFSTCDLNSNYNVEVVRNSKGKIILISAEAIALPSVVK